MSVLSAMNEGYFLSFPPLTSLAIAASLATIALMAWVIRKAIDSLFLSKRRDNLKKEEENPHAVFLRQRMADIWLDCFDRPVTQRTLPLLSVWTTLHDVIRALLREKATFAQLEPEICDFESIIRWLSVEGNRSIDTQEITWGYFSVEGKQEFENILSNYRLLFRVFLETSERYGCRDIKSKPSLLT